LLNRIVDEIHRAGEMLDGVLSLFGRIGQVRQRIDVNEMATGVLQSMRAELESHAVTTLAELTTELLLVDRNRIQLQRVILNMVRNTVEAMDTTRDRDRVLRVKTARHGCDTIALVVQDSGWELIRNNWTVSLIHSLQQRRMGWDCGTCHLPDDYRASRGELSASSDGESGAVFQFVLPSEPMDRIATPVEYR
jgi:phosphoglycerate-specific signal transduction histidine kinase